MSARALLLTTIAASFAMLCAAGCVARHPPWQLYGRPVCADAEEWVDRDRERAAALEASGKRPDELVWYRADLPKALRALESCKKSLKKEDDHEAK